MAASAVVDLGSILENTTDATAARPSRCLRSEVEFRKWQLGAVVLAALGGSELEIRI